MNSTNDPSHKKVIVIGAGISGINLSIQLKAKLNLDDFIIFEGESDVGGTWLVNKYPGAACDVNSHQYSYYNNLNPNWSKNYSGHKEIQTYLSDTVAKFDIRKHIRFSTWVTAGYFDKANSQWRLTYEDKLTGKEFQITCDYLIGAVGALRIPMIPREFTDFQGPMMHSARWDDSVELTNKVVGVIGSGASAVQIIPTIIDKVKELHTFQRNPTFSYPKNMSEYSNWFKFLLNWVPLLNTLYYWYYFIMGEKNLIAFYTNSWASKIPTRNTKESIERDIRDPVKRELMTPKYHFGCKRVTPSDTYYKAIDNDKTFVHSGNVERIEGRTIYLRDGTKQTVDILILATGFNVASPYNDMNLVNLTGDHINSNNDKIGTNPQLNYGITVTKMPNFFMMLGTTTGLGHSSITFMLECQASYIAKILQFAIDNKVTKIELKPEVGDAYWQWIQRRVRPMVWHGNCKSWYQNSNGEVINIWPASCIEYWYHTCKPNLKEYNLTY